MRHNPDEVAYTADEPPRLKAAELKALAKQRAEELCAAGEQLQPVVCSTRKLASHFWGAAWMRHLALCEAGGLCLAPGRTLLRHGCVLDLRIAPGAIHALVSAEQLYEVHLTLRAPDDERREELAQLCSGRIGSLMALLEGQANDELLQLLCEPESGLLPAPHEWHMSCTCPDWTEPCPHAAAAIYAAGVLIDSDPSLLFTLRSVDPASLISLPSPADTADLPTSRLEDIFGLTIDSD